MTGRVGRVDIVSASAMVYAGPLVNLENHQFQLICGEITYVGPFVVWHPWKDTQSSIFGGPVLQIPPGMGPH